MVSLAFQEAVYRVTALIPRGQVATYAQVATYVVSPRYARAVGTALKLLSPELASKIPWQRVINSAGKISARGEVIRPDLQEKLLIEEGVVFDASGKVNLQVFGWTGPGPDWRPIWEDPAPQKGRLWRGEAPAKHRR